MGETLIEQEATISGFMVDEVAVFVHVGSVTDMLLNEVRSALIHFRLLGNCYFIRVTEVAGAEASTGAEHLVEIVKNEIIPALFENKR